ncbi:protein FAM199X-like [Crassostrea virginica]|uniref:Protein FAM199X-like n=1 Tax=Crassostrea virginica TaxID=6565 RepID=A0A8B8CCM4_CRAVI|nr:protein FAM199X-like [Crassostrea virginica]XP_022314036.1 protein FAM199X-like [Crassostrea virginica]
MLADTSTNSPWLCESVMMGHNMRSVLAESDLSQIHSFDYLNRVEKTSPTSSSCPSEVSSECSENLNSTFFSENGSECGDEIPLDIVAELQETLFGDISTSLVNILDIDEEDTSLLDDSHWTTSLESLSSISNVSSSSCSSQTTGHKSTPQPSRRKPINFTTVKWSTLCDEEKTTVIEELSRIISNDLGLREQLEVIRIINPAAHVSPTDKEFVIDIFSINEEKLESIQEYLAGHVPMSSVTSPDRGNVPPKKQNKQSSKKHSSQEKKVRQKFYKQRQRKEYRQMMKERRSGLFAREEVLSVSEIEPGDGEGDVDVLG